MEMEYSIWALIELFLNLEHPEMVSTLLLPGMDQWIRMAKPFYLLLKALFMERTTQVLQATSFNGGDIGVFKIRSFMAPSLDLINSYSLSLSIILGKTRVHG
jgi:hypothetical protein